jgi:hypothetical protein
MIKAKQAFNNKQNCTHADTGPALQPTLSSRASTLRTSAAVTKLLAKSAALMLPLPAACVESATAAKRVNASKYSCRSHRSTEQALYVQRSIAANAFVES